MAGRPKTRARKAAAKTFVDQPNAMDLVCGRIVSAQTLVDVCREFDVHYGTINEWIQSDESRRKRYKDALDIRETHGKEHVFRELIDHLRIDITQAFKDNGELKALEDIPDNVRRFIAGMEVEELYEGSGRDKIEIGRLRKIKFYDKQKAVELLAKHLKMLVDKIEHSADETLSDLIARAKQS